MIKKSSKLQKSLAMVIVTCVAIIFFASFDDIQAKSRDAKRMSNAQEINKALDIYYDKYGKYPVTEDEDYGGWDTTVEPEGELLQFIPQLVNEQILNSHAIDPKNDKIYYYRYQEFPRGSFLCDRPFVIFQVFNFETAQDNHGTGECPERNFADEAPNGFTIQKFY